jgi:protein involved in polysaccharide export with SLBB domain
VRTRKLGQAEKIIRQQKIDALVKQTQDTARAQEIIDKEIANQTTTVGIDLSKIMANPGSRHDLLLEEGDLISIPIQLETVKVSGEVLYPVRIPYNSVRGFKSYVREAGGYSQKAFKRGGYVVYANGSAKATRKFIVFNWHPKIEPGAEIMIPTKEEKKKLTAVEVVSMTTSLTTVIVLIVTLLR